MGLKSESNTTNTAITIQDWENIRIDPFYASFNILVSIFVLTTNISTLIYLFRLKDKSLRKRYSMFLFLGLSDTVVGFSLMFSFLLRMYLIDHFCTVMISVIEFGLVTSLFHTLCICLDRFLAVRIKTFQKKVFGENGRKKVVFFSWLIIGLYCGCNKITAPPSIDICNLRVVYGSSRSIILKINLFVMYVPLLISTWVLYGLTVISLRGRIRRIDASQTTRTNFPKFVQNYRTDIEGSRIIKQGNQKYSAKPMDILTVKEIGTKRSQQISIQTLNESTIPEPACTHRSKLVTPSGFKSTQDRQCIKNAKKGGPSSDFSKSEKTQYTDKKKQVGQRFVFQMPQKTQHMEQDRDGQTPVFSKSRKTQHMAPEEDIPTPVRLQNTQHMEPERVEQAPVRLQNTQQLKPERDEKTPVRLQKTQHIELKRDEQKLLFSRPQKTLIIEQEGNGHTPVCSRSPDTHVEHMEPERGGNTAVFSNSQTTQHMEPERDVNSLESPMSQKTNVQHMEHDQDENTPVFSLLQKTQHMETDRHERILAFSRLRNENRNIEEIGLQPGSSKQVENVRILGTIQRREDLKMKAIKHIGIIVLALTLTSGAGIAFQVFDALCGNCPINQQFRLFTVFCWAINSALNPVINFCNIREFRMAVVQTFKCKFS